MKQSLLEQAKKIKVRNYPERIAENKDELIELALAWLADEVKTAQICKVLNKKVSGNMVYLIAYWLKKAYKQGKIIIN